MEDLKREIEYTRKVVKDLHEDGILRYKATVLGKGIEDPLKEAIQLRDGLLELLKLECLNFRSRDEETVQEDLTKIYKILLAIRRAAK